MQLFSDSREVEADAIIIATGASASRLKFPGADEVHTEWGRGGSAEGTQSRGKERAEPRREGAPGTTIINKSAPLGTTL